MTDGEWLGNAGFDVDSDNSSSGQFWNGGSYSPVPMALIGPGNL